MGSGTRGSGATICACISRPTIESAVSDTFVPVGVFELEPRPMEPTVPVLRNYGRSATEARIGAGAARIATAGRAAIKATATATSMTMR